MGVLNCLADRKEEFDPFLQRKSLRVTIVSDRYTFNQLHNEVRKARLYSAGVEYARDIGVIHYRQGLTVTFEARDDLFTVHPWLDNLQGQRPGGSARFGVRDTPSPYRLRLAAEQAYSDRLRCQARLSSSHCERSVCRILGNRRTS
jgi:hypothetical protein